MPHSRFSLIVSAICCLCAIPAMATDHAAGNSPVTLTESTAKSVDVLRELQAAAISENKADWGYWGPSPEKFSGTTSHSNRLIPVYTFGIDLSTVSGENSVYRSEQRLRQLFGYLPKETLNPQAEYFDQTDIYRLQKQAAENGKKRIILFIFDGMDWHTTRAAAIYRTGQVPYNEGRGTGLHMLDYRGAPTDFGYFVTAPHNSGTKYDVNSQTVSVVGGTKQSGYSWRRGGATPWAQPADPVYLLGGCKEMPHPYTDSAASATSMTAGIKTYNDSVNVDFEGNQVETIAHQLQRKNFGIGVVSSVPISHATPAAAYAHNVHRGDYQDLSRDLLGLPSISHRENPLDGVDVLIGCGWGEPLSEPQLQGNNVVDGNRYLTQFDRDAIDIENGGKYVVAERTAGERGSKVLTTKAAEAIEKKSRLFGYFGYAKNAHLPFSTADGGFDPVVGAKYKVDEYSPDDLIENPRLADMAVAALDVLQANSPKGFWLMVESGDVDWGNHDDNLDCAIGAVFDGDDAIRAITDWVERNGGWDDTVLIVTADHGHYFHLTKPETIAEAGRRARSAATSKQVSDTD